MLINNKSIEPKNLIVLDAHMTGLQRAPKCKSDKHTYYVSLIFKTSTIPYIDPQFIYITGYDEYLKIKDNIAEIANSNTNKYSDCFYVDVPIKLMLLNSKVIAFGDTTKTIWRVTNDYTTPNMTFDQIDTYVSNITRNLVQEKISCFSKEIDEVIKLLELNKKYLGNNTNYSSLTRSLKELKEKYF